MDHFIAVRGFPYEPQLGVAMELAMFKVLAGGWIKSREVLLGEEVLWVEASGGSHGEDSL